MPPEGRQTLHSPVQQEKFGEESARENKPELLDIINGPTMFYKPAVCYLSIARLVFKLATSTMLWAAHLLQKGSL